MTFTKIIPLTSILHQYDAILFDLWGVLVEGTDLYPGVSDAINKLMQTKTVLFVSNSPRLKVDIAKRMQDYGINATPEQFFTSGQMAYDLLHNKQDIYYLANGNDYSLLPAGSTTTSDISKASVILLAAQLDAEEDLEMFTPLFKEAVDLNIPCICANPDKIIPNKGKLRYCPGFFAEGYEEMGGKVTYIGKPGVSIFQQAIESLKPKADPVRILMIGDTLDTDILGANSTGIHSALVLTGNVERVIAEHLTSEDKLRALQNFCETSGILPNFVIDITT
ncbi:MAG: TIGR01459 family HAD-type hydrolase [Pseudomonadota bacterium]